MNFQQFAVLHFDNLMVFKVYKLEFYHDFTNRTDHNIASELNDMANITTVFVMNEINEIAQCKGYEFY